MILAKHALNKKLVGDGLVISSEAKTAKAINPSVIDATIGSLYGEDGKLYLYPTVTEVAKKLSERECFSYSSTDGGPQFSKSVLEWVFQSKKELIEKKMNCKVVATPGGTGALALSLYNSLEPGNTLLLPDLYWGPYANMAVVDQVSVKRYPLLKDNAFNFKGFKQLADEVICEQKKLVFIVNDPCNNPTGYSLTLEELEDIVAFCNRQTVGVTLVYDIAYLDYACVGYDATREKFMVLAKADEHVLVNICFSASKSFSIYGLRCGAQIIMNKDSSLVQTAFESSCYFARSRWSNSNKMGITLLNQILGNKDTYIKMLQEIEVAKKMLENRAQIFIKEAKDCKLDLFKYEGGFFIGVKTLDSGKLFQRLKGQGIFVLPFPGCVRVSISALTMNEIHGLAQAIKNSVNVS